MKSLIQGAIRAPGLVVVALIAIVAAGLLRYREMPVDAFPDISPVMVPVFVEGHGLAPEEIERLVTIPVEAAMNGLPGVARLQSTSAFGMAVVYVYFEDDVDVYFARQLVAERLASVQGRLPELDEPPALGPISTGLGQIFMYYLQADSTKVDTGGKPLDVWLRELNDWVVKVQLQAVRGVTDVLSMGGRVLQYQIRLDPDRLRRYGLGLETVVEAVRSSNRNVGGQFLVLGREEHLVRGIGLLESLEQIAAIPVKTVGGTSVRLDDVAEVAYGSETRRGVVTRDGAGEVVSGIVLKLMGENTSEVIERLLDRVDEVRATLPDGVELVPYYEQSELVASATGTVKKALLVGGALVVLVLLLFLGSWRTALIAALALPVCALVAVLGMDAISLSANLMSLGGIAIAVGMLADGSIVMVENIHRRLAEPEDGRSRPERILAAALEVQRPIVVSIAIIVLVFLPIFTLQGVEGKMFSPLAFTIGFALVGSLFAALVATPALARLLLRGPQVAGRDRLAPLRRAYAPWLAKAVARPGTVVAAAAVALALSLFALSRVGTEFVPVLEEGSIQVGVALAPAISLETAVETVQRLERRALALPEVTETLARIGRPEAGSHPHPVNFAELHLTLAPRESWRPGLDKEALVAELGETLSAVPGVRLGFSQPIQNMFAELLSGVRTQLAIKVFGEDLESIRATASAVQEAVSGVPGLVDLSVEQSFGQPQVQIVADREACARRGVDVSSVLEMVELAVGGEAIDEIFLGTRRFDIHVRYQEAFRDDPQVIEGLLLATEESGLIPLGEVAEVRRVVGPIQINREQAQRRWIVSGNVRGRDLGGVAADIERAIAERVDLPPGQRVEVGGQFENQRRAMARLSLIVPLAVAGVFLMLWIGFGTLRHAAVILLGVPLSLVGGVAGLLLMREYLSVPASVGFIALFGIAVQNGLVLVAHMNELHAAGAAPDEAAREGALRRLRPVLMTALTTVLGLLPLLVATGIGSEVQRPLAVVVVFGLSSSTLLTLFVLPATWAWVERRAAGRQANGARTA